MNKPRHKTIRQAFVLDPGNLGKRVVTGAGFTFLGIVLRTLFTLGSVSVLARLLDPADFGYMAMTAVVTDFAALFGGFGFTNLLIQRRVITRLQMDTVYWASVAVAAALSMLVFALSFLTIWLFDNAIAGELLRVLCIGFLISSLCSVHEAIVARLMRFRTEFWIQITSIAIRAAAAIAFAYYGFGVWSLVAGGIIGAIVTVVLYWIAVPYVPRLRFHAAYLSSTWKVSSSYFGSGFLYYVSMNVDLALIGRSLGAVSLGYYQNARTLTDEIRARIAMPLQRVLFPAFSALQADNERLQFAVIRAGRLLAAIIFPIGIGLSAISNELVPVLYGEKWLEMIPILSMLGISAALRGSTAISSPLFNSRNQVAYAFKLNLIGTVLMVVGIGFTLQFGLHAVAIAIAIVSCYSIVTFKAGLGLIGLGSRVVWEILGLPAFASAVMWLGIFTLRGITTSWTNQPILLLMHHILAGAMLYSTVLHLLSRQYMRDFIELSRKFMHKT